MSDRGDRALQYGATGAALGSAIPGVGTGIGAGAGAAYGYLSGAGSWNPFGGGGGGESDFDRRRREANMVQNPNYGNMGVPNYGQQYNDFDAMGNASSPWSQDQRSFGNVLRQEAMGQGVGQRLVGMQARQAADRASNQQFAALGGARPGMQAMASRNAMLGTAMAQSAVGEQAALGSANMTLGAQGQYGQFMQGARGQDINQQSQNLSAMNSRMGLAGMQQQGNQFDANMGNSRWLAAYGVGPDTRPTGTDKALGAAQGFLSAYNMRPGQRA